MAGLGTTSIDDVDMNNPCDVIAFLKRARLRLLSGEGEILVRFGEDEVRYSKGNLAAMQQEINRLQPECDALNGVKPVFKRRAFSARF